ncbi:2,3,4,5-tetrahydropyridine-2,6-dicarboxylate N-succinyltransferase [Candidatus Mesenet endosymbiont of Agriotes lineatus]|uniref:2,3,4,5-tetrahydropyridine-2,6-dicarboxylate N-succinyltransferase n=1 Tax=Candidatus Mesenet endosymbiont of Agriotes lineatus TaxID=3077948 RepID=UPI0030CEDB12
MDQIKLVIENAWENKNHISNNAELKEAIRETLSLLDAGKIRVAEKDKSGLWKVNDWMKKAILLHFRTVDSSLISFGNSAVKNEKAWWFDKVSSKFDNWDQEKFLKSKIRSVPNSFVRYSAYVAENVVLMPSFVNVGAYVDFGTMVDSGVTIGSCAQIGKNCHISSNVVIGGVLEPLQATPVIIEDNCFIGATSGITEGVIVREGSVLAMGVCIGASTKIIDRKTGKIHYGEIPSYSVVVPGSISSENNVSLHCAVIVKKVDERTRAKTSINELLRE